MQLTPYLSFAGQCEEAFQFYAQVLGGKITFAMKFGEAPGHETTPSDWHTKIMHATLTVGETVLQGADAPPAHYRKPQGFSVALSLSDAAEAERIFKALSENGTVEMPLQETFWALRFGSVLDRFGTPWMINCEKSI